MPRPSLQFVFLTSRRGLECLMLCPPTYSTTPWVLPGLLRYTWDKPVAQSAVRLLGFIPLDPEMWCFRGRIQDSRIGVGVEVPLLYNHCVYGNRWHFTC